MINLIESLVEYFDVSVVSPELLIVCICFGLTIGLDFVANLIELLASFFKDFRKF